MDDWTIQRVPNMCPHCGRRDGIHRRAVEPDQLWYCSWQGCKCEWILDRPSPHIWGDKVKEGYKVLQRKVTPWEEVPLTPPDTETG